MLPSNVESSWLTLWWFAERLDGFVWPWDEELLLSDEAHLSSALVAHEYSVFVINLDSLAGKPLQPEPCLGRNSGQVLSKCCHQKGSGLSFAIVQHFIVRPQENLLAGAVASCFHADCPRGLVQELDVLMDLCRAWLLPSSSSLPLILPAPSGQSLP